MNQIGITLVWLAVQVSFLCLAAWILRSITPGRQHTTRAAISTATVLGVLLLSLISFAPLPSWGLPQIARWSWPEWTSEPAPTAASSSTDDNELSALPIYRAKHTESPWWQPEFWRALGQELAEPTLDRESPRPAWRWPGVTASVLVLGVGLFLTRFAWGVLSLRRYRRHSRDVADASFMEELGELRRRLGIAANIEVRETELISSPATLGWVRPLVLLPADWRHWSNDERRAVLAHELAHVKRGDYLVGLLAQACLAIHFYHPLVHGLVRRMRLEQELAADAWGAYLTRGRNEYLQALARLALRQDDRPVVWAARPFFPRRDTFLRRIEMLRHIQNPLSPTSGRPLRFAALMTLLLTVASVAGLRQPGPSLTGSAFGQLVAGAGGGVLSAAPRFDLSHVPQDAWMVLAARPAELLRIGGVKNAFDAAELAGQFKKSLGLEPQEIEEVVVVLPSVLAQGQPGASPWEMLGKPMSPLVVLIRTSVPIRERFLEESRKESSLPIEEHQLGGVTAYRKAGEVVFFPDEHTLGIGPEQAVQAYAIQRATSRGEPEWAAEWRKLGEKAHFLIATSVGQLPQPLAVSPNGPDQAIVAMLAPMLEQSRYSITAIQLEDGIKIESMNACKDEAGAKQVMATTQAIITLAKNALPQVQRMIQSQPDAEVAIVMTTLLAEARNLLEHFQATQEGSVVRSTTHSEFDAAVVLGLLVPAAKKAREAANRAQSVNNLKQIALAFHLYHDMYQSFPPAVLYGPDGKTPYSWRVAILPFIGQDALHRQYNFNEPWNSEGNLKVAAQMPAVYRHPTAGADTTNSAYFAITGSGTVFDGKEGMVISKIIDGMSNTIMVAEAKRDTPWTKPEDIPYEDGQALPQFGGFFSGGFPVALCDGSVRFLQDNIDQNVLRALITRAGVEVINLDFSRPGPTPSTPRPNQR